jgi:hypothetical protein
MKSISYDIFLAKPNVVVITKFCVYKGLQQGPKIVLIKVARAESEHHAHHQCANQYLGSATSAMLP